MTYDLKERAEDILLSFATMTALVRIKYGNLEPDISREIVKADQLCDELAQYIKTVKGEI
jgi:hypothetical protein